MIEILGDLKIPDDPEKPGWAQGNNVAESPEKGTFTKYSGENRNESLFVL